MAATRMRPTAAQAGTPAATEESQFEINCVPPVRNDGREKREGRHQIVPQPAPDEEQRGGSEYPELENLGMGHAAGRCQVFAMSQE